MILAILTLLAGWPLGLNLHLLTLEDRAANEPKLPRARVR